MIKRVLAPAALLVGLAHADEPPAPPSTTPLARATLAAGCFWCLEAYFERVPGVVDVITGYAGGSEKDATYDRVAAGKTGHREAVQIRFDPGQVTFTQLLEGYWRQIDPTDAGGQFGDRGAQYSSAIFFHDDDQRRVAERSRKALARSRRFAKPIATEIRRHTSFVRAESAHQDFAKKNPVRYVTYRKASGRDRFLHATWADPTGLRLAEQLKRFRKPEEAVLKELLTPLQFQVTQQAATERAFANRYANEKRPGIFVDLVSGEPLFSSRDKYDAKSGWPSFTRSLEAANVVERAERIGGVTRTAVRSKHADSHLGQLYGDGPPPTRKRYSLNSAALRFVAAEDLEREGYGKYRQLFPSW
jgi:peptide methionine sulfoxide reductase msrA/msrB